MTPNDPTNPNNPNTPGYPQQPPQPGYGQQGEYPPPYQPYPAQQPGYPPQQPGYPPPGYGQPGYPSQQLPGQPGYPAYQQPAYPGAPYPGMPPQPPRRSRAGLIAGIIAGVILLCVVACVAGLYFVGTGLQGAASNVLTTLAPTETALAEQLTPSPSESIIYQDTLTDSPDGWANNTHCQFKTDGYYVTGGNACLGPSGVTPADADISVTVRAVTTSQNTSYGLVMRHASQGNYYSFEITPDGQWGVVKFVNGNGTMISQFQSDTSILTGDDASNDLRVVMSGSHFIFFVNDEQVGAMDDSTFAQGDSGVDNDDSVSTSQVVFTNFSIAQPAQ